MGKCSDITRAGVQVAKEPQAQVTAASAIVAGVAGGVSGGTVGLATGGVAGAIVGIVPAFFTFGLSIPCFAVLGGGVGLCAGTAIGGTAGTLGGGATGYTVYAKRNEIRDGAKACALYSKDTFLAVKNPIEAKAAAAYSKTVELVNSKKAAPAGA